jgi:hypothetical protein
MWIRGKGWTAMDKADRAFSHRPGQLDRAVAHHSEVEFSSLAIPDTRRLLGLRRLGSLAGCECGLTMQIEKQLFGLYPTPIFGH